eukprot:752365-Hanusia_phi.AAC.3
MRRENSVFNQLIPKALIMHKQLSTLEIHSTGDYTGLSNRFLFALYKSSCCSILTRLKDALNLEILSSENSSSPRLMQQIRIIADNAAAPIHPNVTMCHFSSRVPEGRQTSSGPGGRDPIIAPAGARPDSMIQ